MRAAAHYSWRLLRHHRMATILVMLLISLGFALATIGLIAANSTEANPRVRLATSMSAQTEAVVEFYGGLPVVQDLTGSEVERNHSAEPRLFAAPSEIAAAITDVAPGAEVAEAIRISGSLVTADAAVDAGIEAVDGSSLWLLPGQLTGEIPSGSQIVVGSELAERLGLDIGSSAELVLGEQRRVVAVGGVVEGSGGVVTALDLIPPEAVPALEEEPFSFAWYLTGTPISWGDVRQLNESGMGVLSRSVVDSAASGLTDARRPFEWMTAPVAGVALGSVVVLVVGLPVLMLTDQRDARSRGVLVSAGAPRALIRRMAGMRGALVAGGGAMIGVAAGCAAPGLTRTIEIGSVLRYAQPPGWALVAMIVTGVLGGAAAGLLASRPWRRGNAMGSLMTRSQKRPSPWRLAPLVLGLVALVVGLNRDSLMIGATGGLLVAGGVAFGLLNILCAIEKHLDNAGLAARYGIREVTRHPSRTAPAIAVIAASGVIVIALSVVASTADETDRAAYVSEFTAGTVALDLAPNFEPSYDGLVAGAVGLENRLAQEFGLSDVRLVSGFGVVRDRVIGTEVLVTLSSGDWHWNLRGSEIYVADTASELGFDVVDPQGVDAALGAGALVVLGTGMVPLDAPQPFSVGLEGMPDQLLGSVVTELVELPAVRPGSAAVVMPSSIAADLGGMPIPTRILAAGPNGVVDQHTEDRVRLVAAQELAGLANPNVYVERGYRPESTVRGLTTAAFIAAGVSGLIAVVVSLLSIAETVRTLATLHQVGAKRRTLSRVSAWVTSSAATVGSGIALVAGLVAGTLLVSNTGMVAGLSRSLEYGAALQVSVSPLVIIMIAVGGTAVAAAAGIAMTPYLVARAKQARHVE